MLFGGRVRPPLHSFYSMNKFDYEIYAPLVKEHVSILKGLNVQQSHLNETFTDAPSMFWLRSLLPKIKIELLNKRKQ